MSDHELPKEGPGLSYYIASDVLSVIFSWVPALFAWTCGVSCFTYFWTMGMYAGCLLTPLAACLGLFLILFLYRMCLPKLEKGVYAAGPNKTTISWWAQVLMGRAVDITGLRPLVFATTFLRFLYFRAMGAQLSYKTQISLNADFVDFSLLTIEEGVLIGEQTRLSGHSMIGDKIILKRVHIKKDAFVSSGCVIGFGTVIGERAQIGFGNKLYNMKVEPGQKIKDFELDRGPKVKSAEG